MTSKSVALAMLLVACSGARPQAVTVTALPERAPVATISPPADEHEDDGCGVFAADGPSHDPVAYRQCLERTNTACEGGSADLVTLELAVALVDGAGGAEDIPRARRLLAGCFEDVALILVREHADAKEKTRSTPALGTCDAFATTTLASTDCYSEHVKTEYAWIRRMRRDYVQDSARFEDAARASRAYAEKMGELAYTRLIGGTMRGPAMASQISSTLHQRRERLATLPAYRPAPVTESERAKGRAAHQAALSCLHDENPDVTLAVDAVEAAWKTYRDAEVALYEHARPGARDAVTLMLESEHTAELRAMTDEP